MRAQPGLMGRRAPAWPLALTIGAHLLLAWLWRTASGPPPAPDEQRVREFMLIPAPLSAPADARRERALPPLAARPLRPREAGRRAATRTATEPQAITGPAPFPDAPAAPAARPMDDPPAQGDARAPGLAERARLAAGDADRALRENKPAELRAPEGGWSRFSERVAVAYKDHARTMTRESYTAPDGTTIYRFRIGNRVFCRTGGSVKPVPSALDYVRDRGGELQFDKLGGEGTAGTIRCPAQASFRPD
ncbi:hypothetical protein B0920_08140 [Massilia sp. KIM]|uniref:hypothetical protein n=1 Tax=Massilia sp. KIM TaxID=1955422 RepID=UPI00098F20F0|nr:hypothetical protein [Massilia sp. KIM]OON63349.1 hypothetical protein B0920_08140 [Massilia sp. KIM]